MTKNEILALTPGRKMDVLIAEHVFGWKWADVGNGQFFTPPDGLPNYLVPHYSTEKAYALDIMDQFEYVYLFKADMNIGNTKKGEWECRMYRDSNDDEAFGYITAPTALEAVCKAALIAMTKKGGN